MALVNVAPMSFLFILFLIVVSGFGNKPKRHKSKRTLRCICVVWGTGSNLEYHINLEGWNSFLILSCLSVFTTRVDAHRKQDLDELQIVLQNSADVFNASNASLYAPLPNINECTRKIMYCYLLELQVILEEEDKMENIVYTLIMHYQPSINCSTCSACEAHPLANSTTFSERMLTFSQKLMSKLSSNNYGHKDCD